MNGLQGVPPVHEGPQRFQHTDALVGTLILLALVHWVQWALEAPSEVSLRGLNQVVRKMVGFVPCACGVCLLILMGHQGRTT